MFLYLLIVLSGHDGKNLQQLFEPLDGRVCTLEPLQASKTSPKTDYNSSRALIYEPLVRIFAIRFAPNLYIITGGAIITTNTMTASAVLANERARIDKVIQWLKDKNVYALKILKDE